MSNYIVLDLEMCMVALHSRTHEYSLKHEIIQIGAVKLDERYEELSRFTTFVKPKYGKVDAFIKDLTGITREDVAQANDLAKAVDEFLNWIGNDEAICVSWSMSDKYQFKKEMRSKGIINEKINALYNTWIDCQQLFSDKSHTERSWSLAEALIASGIDSKGHAHNGLIDSLNTAILFRKLMTEDDFKMIEAYEKVRYGESAHLCVSIGDLIQGMSVRSL